MLARVLMAALWCLVATPWAASAELCTDGTWTIVDGPVSLGPMSFDTVALDDGEPAVHAECGLRRWSVQRYFRGTKVRALFACEALPVLRLRALIGPGCVRMRGALSTPRPGGAVRFVATQEPAPGACLSNEHCADDAFCSRPAGDCAARGQCEPRPLGCPDNVDPVCGCDGQTYSNPCDAAAAGTSIARAGPCRTVCGGFAGIPCAEGEFCELPAGECRSADLQGRCVAVGGMCPLFYDPVCGCDGVTYGNDCERRSAGAQKAHRGACKEPACETPCDCYRVPGLVFADDCPLMCPTCGSYWSCRNGECVEQCGVIPPEVGTCPTDSMR